MQVIKKEKVTTYEVYVAMDGTEFNNSDECIKYENSAKGILFSRYHEYCDVISTNEEEVFYFGCCDSNLDVVKINHPEAVKTILQIFSLYNPHTKKEDLNEKLKQLQNFYDKGSTFFIGRGYDDNEFWIYKYDVEERLNHITKMCNLGKVIINELDEIN